MFLNTVLKIVYLLPFGILLNSADYTAMIGVYIFSSR